MSDSSSELQDEVSPARRFFIAAPVGSSFGKPGERIYRTYLAAQAEADLRNKERELNLARRRQAGPIVTVFALYPRRKKDAHNSGKVWNLIRRTRLHKMDADDILAFRMEEKLARAGKVLDE